MFNSCKSILYFAFLATTAYFGTIAADEPAATNTLATIHAEKLAEGVKIHNGTNGLVLYDLIPHAANQGWALSIADVSIPIPAHYHEKQTQVLIILEGKLKVTLEDKDRILSPGQATVCPAGISHALTPVDGWCRILEIDLVDQPFPQDVFWVDLPKSDLEHLDIEHSEVVVDQTVTNLQELLKDIPQIDKRYHLNHYYNGKYSAHEIIPPGVVEGKPWSTALIEINEAPKHFHLKGAESFFVVNGVLEIEADGITYTLLPGQFITIPPTKTHALRSATKSPVRVICVNFPAFDATDFYLCE